MSGTPNRHRSGGQSSGCSLETFNTLIVNMEGNIYLGGAHELVDIIELQDEISVIDVTIDEDCSTWRGMDEEDGCTLEEKIY